MSKMAVIYWSMSGNTQAMAEAVAQGAEEAGAQVEVLPVGEVTPEQALTYEKLALGCPAMGAEVLEEEEFEPFFAQLEGRLTGRKVALFGSYGWGDGQWMRDWQARTEGAGASLYDQGLMVHETPDEEGLARCRSLGAGLAAF